MSAKYSKKGQAIINTFDMIAINGSYNHKKKQSLRVRWINTSKITLKEKIRIIDIPTYNFSFVEKMSVALYEMSIQNSKPYNVLKKTHIMISCYELINEQFWNLNRDRTARDAANDGVFRKFCRFYRTAMNKGIEIQQDLDKKIENGVPRLKTARKKFVDTYNRFKKYYYTSMYREFQTVIPNNPLNDDVMIEIYSYL
jgi:hypothetical protein